MSSRTDALSLAATALLALALGGPAQAAQAPECHPDTLARNVGQGRVLITQSGWVFETVAGEHARAATWAGEARLMLCLQRIEHKGELRDAWILLNLDRNEQAGAERVK